MPLEKHEGFLKLSLKQFVIQSGPIFLGYIMSGFYKTKY